MSIIKTHNITLYGGNDIDIVLHPLCDDHLPLLYKWCADPEVLYWDTGADAQAYDSNEVHYIYGKISHSAYNFLFLVEAAGVPIGECWLQKMNIEHILESYPDTTDVRRIDIMIGEKSFWNCGIGTTLIGMLVNFAFCSESTDILYAVIFDFNMRSRRAFEKNGFLLVKSEPSNEVSANAEVDLYYRLTKEEFIERCIEV